MNPQGQNKWDVSEKRPYLRKERSLLDVVGRRALPHDPPHFIGTSDAVFFITICCQKRGVNQLCISEVAKILFDATQFYRDQNQWSVPLLLLMPDHLHMLVSFSGEVGLRALVTKWKRYTANAAGIRWQRDFFDHRLRNDENFDEKAAYIRNNPVRTGCVSEPEDWPYQIELA